MNNIVPRENYELIGPIEEEISLTRLLPIAASNPAALVLIPFAFIAFNKNIKGATTSGATSERRKRKPRPKVKKERAGILDQKSIDKVSYLLDTLEKASSLNDAKKSANKTHKTNFNFMKEAIDILGGSQSKEIMQSVSNVVTLMDRARDIKNIANLKKVFTSDSANFSDQIDTVVQTIKPMLSKQQFQNVENFKKMAQMMKVMSALNMDDDDDDDDLAVDTDVEVSTVDDAPIQVEEEDFKELETDQEEDIPTTEKVSNVDDNDIFEELTTIKDNDELEESQ
ncbi:hypothetical protein [Anaeromicrobium sediminis]|uniref:Uncharacterized protein n=1 Tax=Anaeromicrobium sediminis TaxID=1478221 RepID=A0A267MPM3_9FIRM|nr:hypothetical protein [Anaeromicrobium sediminis]PAB60743.1 hypothetical protein CCE28_04185 [Anaeromicrobium sediminis]